MDSGQLGVRPGGAFKSDKSNGLGMGTEVM